MIERSATTAMQDVGVDLPVDMPTGPAPRRPRYIAVEVPCRAETRRPLH